MNKQETIADTIAEMRIFKCRNLETGELESCNAIANYFADRLEAARKRMEWTHKKELETKDAVIQTEVAAREAEREAHKREIDELKKQVGNAVKLREAAKHVQSTMERLRDPTDKNNAEFVRIWEIVSAALAAPPRNCDKYPTFNDAIRALADKRGWHDAKWDSERYCILASWLYVPATEKEGVAK